LGFWGSPPQKPISKVKRAIILANKKKELVKGEKRIGVRMGRGGGSRGQTGKQGKLNVKKKKGKGP